MLNGMKGMLTPNMDKNNSEKKMPKRTVFILIGVVLFAVVRLVYSFIVGSGADRKAMIEFIRTNFHINTIDLVLFTIALVIYLILKFKNKKE